MNMTASQLRKSILQMAVQGRLVPQDPEEEPASQLLEKIRAEKQRLIKEGKIKKARTESRIFRRDGSWWEECDGKEKCIDEEIPFEIPESWEWVRLGGIGKFIRGSSLRKSDIINSGLGCVRYGELYTTYNISFAQTRSFVNFEFANTLKSIEKGDLLITLTGENKEEIGKTVAYVGEEKIVFGSDLAAFIHHGQDPLFLSYLLNSPYAILQKAQLGTGNIIVHISCDKLASILIPLPPLAEQRRIASKLDEIFSYISDYKKTVEELKNISETAKKSILQYAIQGKLVPQYPADEPASKLLEKIRAEKQRLIQEGKIKKPKTESRIFRRDGSWWEESGGKEKCIDEEIPFEIPESWEWVRLESILTKLTDGTHLTPTYVHEGVPFLSVKDISNGEIDLSHCKYIDKEEHDLLFKRCNPEYGDILLTKVGTTGIPVIVNMKEEFSIFVSLALLKFKHDKVNKFFLKYALNSPLVQIQASLNTKGVGNKNWVIRDIGRTLLPLPPLAEQRRIAAKLDEFMAMERRLSQALKE